MEENGATSPTLFVQDNTSGEYVEYTPPAPPAFQDTLPEDLKGSEHLKDVEDPHTLARYYVDLKKDYLRAPETPDGYEFEAPEGFMASPEEMSKFKQVAHENGINQKQFEQLIGLEATRQKEALTALKTQMEQRQAEAETALKTEWGDNYEKKLESARRVLNHEKIADDEFKKFLEDTRFGDHPRVIKLFAKMADLISEDTFNKPGTGDEAPKAARTEDGRPMLKFPSMQK